MTFPPATRRASLLLGGVVIVAGLSAVTGASGASAASSGSQRKSAIKAPDMRAFSKIKAVGFISATGAPTPSVTVIANGKIAYPSGALRVRMT